MKSEKKGIALVPGSFDPITYGHIDIIKRAAEKYEQVHVAVMINSEKRYTFSLEERTKIATVAVQSFSNVDVISSDGMLWELARDLGADAIVKGYRNSTDLEYEKKMAEFNEAQYPNAKTVLLPSAPELVAVSSTAVREKLSDNKSLDDFLPECVLNEINKILASRK